MFRKILFNALFLLICVAQVRAQWVAQESGTDVRLRGVSAVNSRVAWVSGNGGTYARTTDGGRTWQSGKVPDASGLDFRDVDAFDADTAYLLAIGEGERSRIYKTSDGGRHWSLQFQNNRAGAFYDCMAFWDSLRGIALSDPVDGRFLVLLTDDGGRSWHEAAPAGLPRALEGEGGFAASGTCVTVGQGERRAWFGTGGPNGSRVFRSDDYGRTWDVSAAPLAKGKAAGVFSLAFYGNSGVAVGGDYTKEGDNADNIALTYDAGKIWRAPASARPRGYRSGVAYVHGTNGRRLIAVGPSGSDYSTDGGRTWKPLGDEGFHAVSVTPRGDAAWAVGENGRVSHFDAPAKVLGWRRR